MAAEVRDYLGRWEAECSTNSLRTPTIGEHPRQASRHKQQLLSTGESRRLERRMGEVCRSRGGRQAARRALEQRAGRPSRVRGVRRRAGGPLPQRALFNTRTTTSGGHINTGWGSHGTRVQCTKYCNTRVLTRVPLPATAVQGGLRTRGIYRYYPGFPVSKPPYFDDGWPSFGRLI